jgi:hypothetical protein
MPCARFAASGKTRLRTHADRSALLSYFNVLITSEAAPGLIAAVMTTGVMLLALVALVIAGPRELRGLSRRAGPRQKLYRFERLAA